MSKKQKKNINEEECCCHSADQCDSNCDCDDEDCCDEIPHLQRRFYTKAEQIELLEAYLADLKAEVAGVEETLADLKK